MMKKLVRHGNSRALVIEKPILELLNIAEDTYVEITTDGESLIMRPIRPEEARRLEFEAAAAEAIEKYDSTFDRLSK